MTHPSITLLREAAAVHSHGPELEEAIRKALVAAAEAGIEEAQESIAFRRQPEALAVVANLLGEGEDAGEASRV